MSPEGDPHTLFDKIGRVGVITLNRPKSLNAWTGEMSAKVQEHLEECLDKIDAYCQMGVTLPVLNFTPTSQDPQERAVQTLAMLRMLSRS